MPWVEGAHCPACKQIVVPRPGDLLTACLCRATFVGYRGDELVVVGPDDTARVPVHVPFGAQLTLPGVR